MHKKNNCEHTKYVVTIPYEKPYELNNYLIHILLPRRTIPMRRLNKLVKDYKFHPQKKNPKPTADMRHTKQSKIEGGGEPWKKTIPRNKKDCAQLR